MNELAKKIIYSFSGAGNIANALWMLVSPKTCIRIYRPSPWVSIRVPRLFCLMLSRSITRSAPVRGSNTLNRATAEEVNLSSCNIVHNFLSGW